MRSPCEDRLVQGKGNRAMHPILGIILLGIFATALVVVGMFCIHCLFEQGEGKLGSDSDEEPIAKEREMTAREAKNMQ